MLDGWQWAHVTLAPTAPLISLFPYRCLPPSATPPSGSSPAAVLPSFSHFAVLPLLYPLPLLFSSFCSAAVALASFSFSAAVASASFSTAASAS